MLNELFHIPEATGKSVVRWFFHAEPGSVNTWQPYEIPRNHSMVFIFGISGGAGGGSGFSAAAGNARGGGGGGGGGSIARFLGPRILLPDVVYIRVGNGGAPGVTGSDSVVSVIATNVQPSGTFFRCSSGSQGGNGTGATPGSGGGNQGTSIGAYASEGLYLAVNSQGGTAGGAVAGGAGVSITWGGSGFPFSGGAGGGSTTSADFAGGNITGAGLFPTINGGAAGSNNGGDGVGQTLGKEAPFFFSGGAGGGASNAGNGGNGGNGGLGCGGGGGGGGVVGGTGGVGGNGFVMIQSW